MQCKDWIGTSGDWKESTGRRTEWSSLLGPWAVFLSKLIKNIKAWQVRRKEGRKDTLGPEQGRRCGSTMGCYDCPWEHGSGPEG